MKRTDIQALRAIAVLAVVLFHALPALIPGGYAGVDVFFVISGFLMGQHLIQHHVASLGALTKFYARRIRRLLPAASIVIAVTVLAFSVFAPITSLERMGWHALSSVLFVANWSSISTATDYLQADASPLPTQHYWSLSVEEQYYLFLPLLVILAYRLTKKKSAAVTMLLAGLLLVGSASLAFSVYQTEIEPAIAYFSTFTRVWELILGSVLAAALARWNGKLSLSAGPILGLKLAGYALIFASFWVLTSETPFPGYMALVPCLGAVLVLGAESTNKTIGAVEGAKPVSWLGDHSYSLYLWHWPVLTFLSLNVFNLNDEWVIASITVGASLLLAWVTKKHIEDRFRFGKIMKSDRRTFVVALVLMASTLSVSFSPMAVVASVRAQNAAPIDQNASAGPTTEPSASPGPSQSTGEQVGPSQSAKPEPSEKPSASASASATPEERDLCLGADEARNKFPTECPTYTLEALTPNILTVADDLPAAYPDECWNWPPFVTRINCSYGSGKLRVALVGNSHAGQWLSPIITAAKKLNFSITTYLSSSCNTTDALLNIPSARQAANCLKFGKWVKEQLIAGDYDLIITSQRQVYGIDGKGRTGSHDLAVQNYQSYFKEIAETSKLLVIRDVIAPVSSLGSIPDCLAANPQELSKCDWTRQSEEYTDPLWDALTASKSANVSSVDLNTFFCGTRTCKAVIGGIVTFRDSHHITDTYAKQLEPELTLAISKALSKKS